MAVREIYLNLLGVLRSLIPARVRRYIQGSPILHNLARHGVASLLRMGGKVQEIRDGAASGIFLLISEHVTEVYLTGRYETEVQIALEENLKPGDVMYDLGASIGFFSLLGGKLVGSSGKVYAFEPAPHAFMTLVKQVSVNRFDWVIPVQKCLADRAKRVRFAVIGNAYGSSIVPAEERRWPILELEATSIDELVGHKTFLPPHLIKIDVEDEEGNVLIGATNTLREYKPIIICEVHSSRSGRVIVPILDRLGYRCRVLGETNSDWHMIEHLEEGIEKRILAVPPSGTPRFGKGLGLRKMSMKTWSPPPSRTGLS